MVFGSHREGVVNADANFTNMVLQCVLTARQNLHENCVENGADNNFADELTKFYIYSFIG